MSKEAIIKIKGLHKSFASEAILKNLDLEIIKGQINFIIGRSGGGKSVLLRTILGLLPFDGGNIFIDKLALGGLKPAELNMLRQRFGVLFQEAALFDSLSVLENVSFPLEAHNIGTVRERKKKASEFLALVGLEGLEAASIAELSGGQKKRVGLARALIRQPEFLFFDEPTTGLDPILSEQVDDLIVETHRLTKATVIVVSHDMPATFKIAHQVSMIYKGQVILSATPQDFRQSTNPVIKQFIEGREDGPMEFYN